MEETRWVEPDLTKIKGRLRLRRLRKVVELGKCEIWERPKVSAWASIGRRTSQRIFYQSLFGTREGFVKHLAKDAPSP